MSRRRSHNLIHRPTLVLIMAVAVFLLSLAARAATVTGFSDLMTRLQVNVAADHEIKFVTPSGVDALTDTITVDFESDFDLSSIGFDDVDLAVDTDATPNDCTGTFTDKTLAAAAGLSPTWGAAVSGQILTLTPPTDALLGEIAADSCVRVRIGTNAVVGSTGNNQIVNPSTPVAHSVVIGGGFGDSGSADILINDGDQIGISATVSGGGGGGGGCPPTCPPPSAPVIFNIRVENITETAADVLWDTDIASSSAVDYGTTVGYGSTVTDGASVFNHSVHLSGLTPGTLYHFRVRSTGSGTPEAVSGDNTFTTLDTTAPVLSNIQAVDITGTSARITWDTNEDANSRVEYGLSEPYSNFVADGTMTNAHSMTLTGLTPNTTYVYRVISTDASGNTATSGQFSFTTLDTIAPVISDIHVDAITETSARVNWTTDELANSTVRYGLTDAYGSTVTNGSLVANHQIVLTGLAPGTLYHFNVSSSDASGNEATSADQTFMTLPDNTPPANVSNLTVTPGNSQNTLNWINPGDADFAGVKIQRSTSGYPATPSSGTTVYDSNGTSFVDVGLVNGTTYYYTAFAYDASGNFASGALANGTPFDLVPPGPVTGLTVTPGNSQNTLDWTNPSDPDFSNVQIQRSTSAFPATPGEGTTVYTGGAQTFVDTGLTNGTTYYYSVFAQDTSGNFSGPAQGSGTPSAAGPVCGDNICTSPEDASSCPADCAPSGPVCGNAACEAPETNASCPADCPPGPPPPPAPFCGDAICDPDETNLSCPVDCPVPPQPPVETPPQTATEPIDQSLIRFYALNRTLLLHQDSDGIYHILPSRTLSILIPANAPTRPVLSMTLNFAGGSYLFTPPLTPDGNYSVDVSAPAQPQLAHGTIIIAYTDNTNDVVPFDVRVEPLGQIYETKDGTEVPVPGAVVTIYKRIGDWIVWDATPYHQVNPVTVGADGAMAFMVPQGEYYIEVKKDGYRTLRTPSFQMTTEVINSRLELIALPPSITDVIIPGAPVTENLANIANALAAQGAYVTKIFQNEIIENPTVKTVSTQFIVPAAAALAAIAIATAVQATSIISYLYFLLTQPLLLLGRRKRKEFGTVYNSLTKMPVDLAIVRLFRPNGKLVRTLVTDKQGRYAFLVDPGEYRIEVSRQGYAFPSQYLKERREDGPYLDLYHGETITVRENGAVITANIPMDPLTAIKTNRRIMWEDFLRRGQNIAAFSSVILTSIIALLYRQTYLYVLVVIQILIFLLFRRLARPAQPKNWGIIYDERTKKPVPFAVARIVETQYNKVLESRLTDSRGRYNFLVGSNKYFVSVEKPGYESTKSSELDLTRTGKEGGVVSVDIPMKEKKNE